MIEAVGLAIKSLNLMIFNLYRQPNDPTGGNLSTSTQFALLLAEITKVIESQPAPTPNVVIAGDFNLPHTF